MLHEEITCAMLAHLADNVYEENNLYNAVSTLLRQHCRRKLLVQYWPKEHRHVFAGKLVVVLNDW